MTSNGHLLIVKVTNTSIVQEEWQRFTTKMQIDLLIASDNMMSVLLPSYKCILHSTTLARDCNHVTIDDIAAHFVDKMF